MNHNFKKKYGQNFLKDKNILKKIIEVSDVKENSLIIEIGAGAGALTEELIKKGEVLSYEIDKDLQNELEEKFKDKNVTFIFDDFLNRNIVRDLESFVYENIYVIANLPYYITTPIINKIIDEKIDVTKMTLMVQKEVGERFSAKENSKDYSSITVFLNYYFDVKKEFLVSKNCFVPKPDVDSMVISLTKKEAKSKVKNEEYFFNLVKESFKFKRKTLKNNLKNYDFSIVLKVLEKYGFNENVRAEEIPIKIFIEIANNLYDAIINKNIAI